jgi:transposase
MKKCDARKLKPEVQEAIRIRVAFFLKAGKGTQRQAADVFMVSIRAVEKIWKQYKAGGRKALAAKKRGPHKNTSKLSSHQVKKITRLVKKNTPDSYGIPYFLWTADAVRLLIKKKPGSTTGFPM